MCSSWYNNWVTRQHARCKNENMYHNLYAYFWSQLNKTLRSYSRSSQHKCLQALKLVVSGSWFSLAHSQWSAAWINKDPPPSLSVIELYFIGSLRMHSTNIFDQWYLILFLPTPFASANTIIHSSFSYLCFFHFLHCMFSTSAFLLIHAIHVFTFPFLCLLYSIPLFIFLFPSVSRRALWGVSTAAMQCMIRIFVMYINEIKHLIKNFNRKPWFGDVSIDGVGIHFSQT